MRLAKEVVGSPCLEILEVCLDAALSRSAKLEVALQSERLGWRSEGQGWGYKTRAWSYGLTLMGRALPHKIHMAGAWAMAWRRVSRWHFPGLGSGADSSQGAGLGKSQP